MSLDTGRTIGPKRYRHSVTGERKTDRLQEITEVERVARKHGWSVGKRESLNVWLVSQRFWREDAPEVPGVSVSIDAGRIVNSNACKPERILLLLEGLCSCEGHPRTGPFDHYSDHVTDDDCSVHEGEKR